MAMKPCCPSLRLSQQPISKVSGCSIPTARDCSTPVTVICPSHLLSVYICNSNAVTDDKWSLWLDGVYIGMYDVGDEYRATIILPQSAMGKTINGLTGRGCSIFDYFYSSVLDTTRTSHRLSMKLEQIKGFGNMGSVQFLCSTEDTTSITLATTPGGSFSYGSPTPYVVGAVVDYNIAVKDA